MLFLDLRKNETMNAARLLIFMIILLIGIPIRANSSNKSSFIKKELWSKRTKGYDYTENYKTREFKANSSPKIRSISDAWVKYMVWALIIAVICVALVYLIISISKSAGNKVRKEKIKSAEVIENIEETDLEYLLEQALLNGMFKEAVRFRYLILIRALNRMKLITWKKDKTNGAYVREMFSTPGFDIFRQLTLNFERIWYGEQVITENEYKALIPVFEHMNKMIESE
jgi:hypothetical protein